MKSQQELLTQILVGADSCPDIMELLLALCELENIEHATFHMITNANSSLAMPFVKTTYPQEWITYYLVNNFMACDPVVGHAQTAKEPFFWADIRLSSSASVMMAKAADFGLSVNGFTVPTFDIGPYRGLLSISPDSAMPPEEWRTFIDAHTKQIVDLAYAIHTLARVQIDPYEDYASNLSPREIECLKYIAEGKTHIDIATILDISEHTVRSYCRALRLKLNCSTLAQAVAKACAMGII